MSDSTTPDADLDDLAADDLAADEYDEYDEYDDEYESDEDADYLPPDETVPEDEDEQAEYEELQARLTAGTGTTERGDFIAMVVLSVLAAAGLGLAVGALSWFGYDQASGAGLSNRLGEASTPVVQAVLVVIGVFAAAIFGALAWTVYGSRRSKAQEARQYDELSLYGTRIVGEVLGLNRDDEGWYLAVSAVDPHSRVQASFHHRYDAKPSVTPPEGQQIDILVHPDPDGPYSVVVDEAQA